MENYTCVNTNNNYLLSTSLLSKIQSSDKTLLRERVQYTRPHTENYEDSWGYIIQATRFGGFKYYDPKTKSLIFFGRKSFTDATLVIPSFFSHPKYLKKVLTSIQNTLHVSQIILKNVNDEDIIKLLPYGFRPYKNHERWSENTRFDDQTYPQSIIDLEKVAKKSGGGYKNLRTTLNKKPNFTIRKYRISDKNDVLALFALRDKNVTNIFDRSQGVYFSSHAMYPAAAIDKFVITETESTNLIGFTATSEISSDTTALVASIFNPEYKRASVWGIYQTLMIQFNKGYKKINFGGSARPGTYNFKRRTFQQTKQIKKTHLIYQ